MAADYTSLIQQLHLIYLGRHAMPIERSIMEGQLAAAGAPATLDGLDASYRSSPAVAAIIDGLAGESTLMNAQDQSAISLIVSLYPALFGRVADLGGLLFWAKAIQEGSLSRLEAPLSIVAGATANSSAQSHIDTAIITTKTAIGDIIDLFAHDVAPTLHWVVNSPAASLRLFANWFGDVPASEYVDLALGVYGVGKYGSTPSFSLPHIVAPTPPTTTVSIDAPSIAEGNSGKAALIFHLTLNEAPSSDLAVYYATVPGTAGTGDFQSLSGRIVFAAGQTSATVTVQVTGDAQMEQNETFSLIVGGPGIHHGVEAIGTIVNDDAAVPVTLVGNYAPYHAPLLF